MTFLSKAAIDLGVPTRLGLRRLIHPVSNTRNIGKRDLVRNDTLADIKIDPETYTVRVNGEVATCEPATRLPLAQGYYFV